MRPIRHLWKTLAIGGVLGALPAGALAAPSYLGPSGYILTPDATVTPANCVDGGFHFFDNNRGPNFGTLSGNYGIADHFEVGGSFFGVDHGDDAVWVNVKASALKPDQPFQLAGGIIDLFDDTDRAGYVVGSFNAGEQFECSLLPRTLRVGAGWGSGNFIDGVFVNGGILVGPIQLIGEWIDRGGLVDLGGRYQRGGLTVDLAGVDLAHHPFPAFGVGYGYCFGHCKKSGGKSEPEKGEPEKGEKGGYSKDPGNPSVLALR